MRRIPKPCVRLVFRGRAGKVGVTVIQGSGAQACGARGPIGQGPRFRVAQYVQGPSGQGRDPLIHALVWKCVVVVRGPVVMVRECVAVVQ